MCANKECDLDREADWLQLSWKCESAVCFTGEPDEFVYEASGKVLDGMGDVVGEFRLFYVDLNRAVVNGCDAECVFDAYSSTYECYAELFTRAGDLKAKVKRLLGDDWVENVLVLDRLEILPEYRRRGLGLKIIQHMIERFGAGASLVAIKPFPLQFAGSHVYKTGNEVFPAEDQRQATKKLQNYYSKLGFLRVSGSPLMVRPVDRVALM